ncbi:MAG: low temperature requirement protein A [Oligoflexia bacterium]|nr:low temperature requirement protein A [Oligoflexia bacterium]
MNTAIHHHRRKMTGRDPHETHRVATPLELLLDLTFVISFGFAASQFAHAIAEAHYRAGLLGFGFASYAICLAWSNFTWFASAYDIDDWIYRICTMTQMIGVLILAIGLPGLFASLEENSNLNSTVIVCGYIVMRVALIFQWLRAAKEDQNRRSTCLRYAGLIFLAQLAWTLRLVLELPTLISTISYLLLLVFEFMIPRIAEKEKKETPWHAHHIVERYGLFAIIALGEGIVGTASTLSAIIGRQGWSMDTVFIGIAGATLTFLLWWIYFLLPSAHVLHRKRSCAQSWSLFQIILVVSIVAVGTGLHVAAYFIEGKAHISALATVLSVAIPVSIFLGTIYYLYYLLAESFDRFHLLLFTLTLLFLVITLFAAISGLSMTYCLLLLVLVPLVTVVGYEIRGYRHQEARFID